MDIIGELAPDQARTLADLEPVLHRAWNSTGTWREMVEEQMWFQPTFRFKVKNFWCGYIAAAEAQGLPARPYDLVLSFVNQNFPHMIDGGEVH
ncbi:hypothetical protein HS961_06130 [Comamonas piscis]|uniref:Uncharacterized protein n=1 Tax=Comamonas piscis TaxID=1562974 RepID=A0A7G5EEM2_9BURK|nr:hypothetical protein [Comamonas piscis]QMV72447.1 hypothetical protein HS961_06130 [Comamonas piscis]WSO35215.1 hypothetical protein VUJ63_06155 [Comamonas piscis]